MSEHGFLVRFEDKEEVRCASTCPPKPHRNDSIERRRRIELDHDSWEYKTNGRETKKIPAGVKTITVQVEEG